MTKKETSELMGVLMIAYPAAELFRASSKAELRRKLEPTINLWAATLKDVDYWHVQNGLVEIIKTHKFLPTVAELRIAAADFQTQTDMEMRVACTNARNAILLAQGDKEKALELMPPRTQKTIKAMGGMEVFAPDDMPCVNLHGFKTTYENLLRRNPLALPISPNNTLLEG